MCVPRSWADFAPSRRRCRPRSVALPALASRAARPRDARAHVHVPARPRVDRDLDASQQSRAVAPCGYHPGMHRWLVVIALVSSTARADVVDSAPNGFTVKAAIVVAAPAAKAWAALLEPRGWWDKNHTWSGDASNLSLDASTGGCFCEKLPAGGGVRHMTVVYADPGKLLRLTGGLGPLQDLAVAA